MAEEHGVVQIIWVLLLLGQFPAWNGILLILSCNIMYKIALNMDLRDCAFLYFDYIGEGPMCVVSMTKWSLRQLLRLKNRFWRIWQRFVEPCTLEACISWIVLDPFTCPEEMSVMVFVIRFLPPRPTSHTPLQNFGPWQTVLCRLLLMIFEIQVQIWKCTLCICNLVSVEISSWMYTKQHLQICGFGLNYAY